MQLKERLVARTISNIFRFQPFFILVSVSSEDDINLGTHILKDDYIDLDIKKKLSFEPFESIDWVLLLSKAKNKQF